MRPAHARKNRSCELLPKFGESRHFWWVELWWNLDSSSRLQRARRGVRWISWRPIGTRHYTDGSDRYLARCSNQGEDIKTLWISKRCFPLGNSQWNEVRPRVEVYALDTQTHSVRMPRISARSDWTSQVSVVCRHPDIYRQYGSLATVLVVGLVGVDLLHITWLMVLDFKAVICQMLKHASDLVYRWSKDTPGLGRSVAHNGRR